jgi:hypothetical protein
VVLVVPDGVAEVTLVVRPPDVSDKAPVSVTGAANNNVVALIVPGTPDMPTENMIWYDRSGHVTGHWSRSRDLRARSH